MGSPPHGRVAAVRRFNRFYTRRIGVLRQDFLGSPFSLTEVRVLYELAHRDRTTATELCADLDLDPGYLSRILRRFERGRLITRRRSATDGRRSHVALTALGRRGFAPLDRRQQQEVAGMLGRLGEAAQRRLLQAMRTIEQVLGAVPTGRTAPAPAVSTPPRPYRLRTHRPGDMGWVVHRHGVLYAREYGWDERFEALVAGIAGRFIERFKPTRERCWIAERDGAILGSVFLVERSPSVAQLRLLLVEPSARGQGIGARLVAECVRFARQAGYRKIMLWTNSVLTAARRLYEAAGFRLVRRERHHSFGHVLIGETWELDLHGPAAGRGGD